MRLAECTTDRPSRARLAGVLDDGDVLCCLRVAVRDPAAQLSRWWIEDVDYPFGSPNTGGLFRIRAAAEVSGGTVPWSAFVKVVRSYRHWPMIDLIPAPMREAALSGTHWRYEADVYLGDLAEVLPPGMRRAEAYLVKDLGDERLVLVLEDVATTPTPWSTSMFARAAGLLGRLGVRLTARDVLPRSASRAAVEVTRRHYTGRVLPAVLPVLADAASWRHPLLVDHQDLRRDMLGLADRLPAILVGLADLPQLMVHGDASPQNLLVLAPPSDEIVVVDWTLGGLAAVGDDLGQLLVGLAHAGELSTALLPRLRRVTVDAYVEGLAVEGMHVDAETVTRGVDGGLAVRSALTAIPFERLGEPVTEELAALFGRRLELTRFLVDLVAAMPDRLGGGRL